MPINESGILHQQFELELLACGIWLHLFMKRQFDRKTFHLLESSFGSFFSWEVASNSVFLWRRPWEVIDR